MEALPVIKMELKMNTDETVTFEVDAGLIEQITKDLEHISKTFKGQECRKLKKAF